MFEFRHQPVKTIYFLVTALGVVCVRLPFWLITAIPPSLRPRRSWTIGRTVLVAAMHAFVETWYGAGMPRFPGQDPDEIVKSGQADELGFAWVAPIASQFIAGEIRELAQLNVVSAQKTFGYWYTTPTFEGRFNQVAAKEEKVVLHLHGGGYVVSTPHPKGGAIVTVANGLLECTSKVARIFACGFRLSSSAPFPAANAFPAALFDALSGYYYLVNELGFRAENVIIGGDSSGGHLAIALVRYLVLHNFSELPVPAGVLLLSPMTEWCNTHSGKRSSLELNSKADFAAKFFAGYTLRSLVGNMKLEDAEVNPWVSPSSLRLPNPTGLFKDFPKTFIVIGDAEVDLDSVHTLRDRFFEDIGRDNVVYVEKKDATHDFVGMPWHEPERSEALKEIGQWIESVWTLASSQGS